MQDLKFTNNYKNNETLRNSFFELAASTFDIHFENWYQQGCWGEGYIPFSFVDGDQIVANASVNILELIIQGEKKKAIQIGTVMTHPDYRGKGLSASLMNKILEEYENKYDLMYLFANESVLDFYPKFGFKAVEEHLFSMDFHCTANPLESAHMRKLDVTDAEDLQLIQQFASQRLPVSKRFATDHTPGIFMFYCLNVFNDDIYYLENEKVIVIYQKENENINLFDVVSLNEINMRDIVNQIADTDTNKVTFHFTPDVSEIELKSTLTDEGLFVRTPGDHIYPIRVKHPVTSIA